MHIEKIDATDEVLQGPAKYRIKDDSDNIIVDNCTIELVTLVIEQGIDINKAMFDKIDNNFEEIVKEFKKIRRTGLQIYWGW